MALARSAAFIVGKKDLGWQVGETARQGGRKWLCNLRAKLLGYWYYTCVATVGGCRYGW